MSKPEELIDAYARGPSEISRVVSGLPDRMVDLRPVAGKWSIREVVCHLADSDIVYADRMKRVIAEEEPSFFDADPDILVPGLFCTARSISDELEMMSSLRAHMLSILRACGEDAFQRVGIHSTDGPMSLETLLRRVTEHVPHHLKFVREKLQALDDSGSFNAS